MLKSIISVVSITLLLACNSQKDIQIDNEHKFLETKEVHYFHLQINDNKKESDIKINNSNNSTLTPIINSYLHLKNSLVEDNSNKAATEGKNLIKKLKNYDKSLEAKSKLKEFSDLLEDAIKQTEQISESSKNIELQRKYFEKLSKNIKILINSIGSYRTLYIVNCPMYNNSKGGMWISESKEIKNPYYGIKMIKCGSVVSTINRK